MLSVEADAQINRGRLWFLLAGVFLISFSMLAFEITLTRILSVVLVYHYVFVVVSLALLGLGTGGIFVYLFRQSRPGRHGRLGSLGIFPSLFSLSIPLSVMLIARIAYIDNILLYCLVLLIPFFLVGAFLAGVFLAFPTLSSKIYGADLIGAAAGSLGAVLILNSLGGINSSLLLALVASIAALLIATTVPGRNIKGVAISIVSLVIVLGLLGVNLIGSYLPAVPIGTNPDKEIFQFLEIYHGPEGSSASAEIIETRWSAFGRTDLVASSHDSEEMGIYIDGTAGTPMYRFNGDFDNPDPRVDSLKTDFPGYFPFFFLQEDERDNALIIGPGGGRDILVALMGGVGEVTAVEVNRELVDIVREYAWYNGGIYTDLENVTVIVDEGRNFLKRQSEKYDIIMLTLPVTNTSRSLEGYSLTENFLLTTDSISDYLEHLTDEGRLIVVAHDPVEIFRLLSIALDALNQRGIDNEAAMKQIYIVGAEMYPVFVLKKTAFESTKMESIHQSIHELGYDPTLSYVPGIRQGDCAPHMEGIRFDECAMLNPALMTISRGQVDFSDLERSLKEEGVDVSSVTDNSPFFYKFQVGIPQAVSQVFWSAMVMMILVALVPPLYLRRRLPNHHKRRGSKRGFNKNQLRFVVLFLMLGIGFMLAEISLIQRLVLFLGQPVLSLTVLLFSLLVGAGIGSIYSGRLPTEKIIKVIAVVSISIVAVLISYTFLLPLIFNQLLGLELAIRLLAAVVILTPLGFLMGFPFPSGLRLLKEMRMEDYIPWMWGINGISSVLGSAMAIVIAISLGFREALLVAAGCYFIIFLIFQTTRETEFSFRKDIQ